MKQDPILAVQNMAPAQRGVFSRRDLEALFDVSGPSEVANRVRRLQDQGVLRRFCRGWYVTDNVHLPTLSQRLAPDSIVSMTWVLSSKQLIGPASRRRIEAVRTTSRGRIYDNLGHQVVHRSISPNLIFGYHILDGIRYATPEKAYLDVLHFHLAGNSFPFDIYSDVAIDLLDPETLKKYILAYKNPKFRSFASEMLGLSL